jgi:hypothetical protein
MAKTNPQTLQTPQGQTATFYVLGQGQPAVEHRLAIWENPLGVRPLGRSRYTIFNY